MRTKETLFAGTLFLALLAIGVIGCHSAFEVKLPIFMFVVCILFVISAVFLHHALQLYFVEQEMIRCKQEEKMDELFHKLMESIHLMQNNITVSNEKTIDAIGQSVQTLDAIRKDNNSYMDAVHQGMDVIGKNGKLLAKSIDDISQLTVELSKMTSDKLEGIIAACEINENRIKETNKKLDALEPIRGYAIGIKKGIEELNQRIHSMQRLTEKFSEDVEEKIDNIAMIEEPMNKLICEIQHQEKLYKVMMEHQKAMSKEDVGLIEKLMGMFNDDASKQPTKRSSS